MEWSRKFCAPYFFIFFILQGIDGKDGAKGDSGAPGLRVNTSFIIYVIKNIHNIVKLNKYL